MSSIGIWQDMKGKICRMALINLKKKIACWSESYLARSPPPRLVFIFGDNYNPNIHTENEKCG